MEYIGEDFFKIKYNAKVNRLQMDNPKWTSKLKEKIKKHKIISIAIALFILFLCVDFFLIYNFMKVVLSISRF